MGAGLAGIRAELGDIDIYLYDQLARGRIGPQDTVLDAGCGFGRNLVAPMRLGCQVLAADADADAVDEVRRLAAELAPAQPSGNFRVEPVEAMSFDDRCADVVICSAVLHFARDDEHFDAMVRSLWRCLRPGGLLFCRLASSIGADLVGARRVEGRRHRLGDGTERYLADESQLMELTSALDGDLADPLKTTIVQGQRCMTTWVVRRR
jgi:SAM-dependent methyltransferase